MVEDYAQVELAKLRAAHERLHNVVASQADDILAMCAKYEHERVENERLRTGIKEALDLLADGPGGPRRLSAIKFLEELIK